MFIEHTAAHPARLAALRTLHFNIILRWYSDALKWDEVFQSIVLQHGQHLRLRALYVTFHQDFGEARLYRSFLDATYADFWASGLSRLQKCLVRGGAIHVSVTDGDYRISIGVGRWNRGRWKSWKAWAEHHLLSDAQKLGFCGRLEEQIRGEAEWNSDVKLTEDIVRALAYEERF